MTRASHNSQYNSNVTAPTITSPTSETPTNEIPTVILNLFHDLELKQTK